MTTLQIADPVQPIMVELTDRNTDGSYNRVSTNVYIAPSLRQLLLVGDSNIFGLRLYTNSTVFIISDKQYNQIPYAREQQFGPGVVSSRLANGNYPLGNQQPTAIYLPDRWATDDIVEFLDILDSYTIDEVATPSLNEAQQGSYHIGDNADWLSIFTLSEFLDVKQLEELAAYTLAYQKRVLDSYMAETLPLAKKWLIYLYVPTLHNIPADLQAEPVFMRQWLANPKTDLRNIDRYLVAEDIIPKNLARKSILPYDVYDKSYHVYGLFNKAVLTTVVIHDSNHYPLLEAEVFEINTGRRKRYVLNGGYYVYWSTPVKDSVKFQVRQMAHYKMGTLNGPYAYYYRDGKDQETGGFQMDIPVGVRLTYDGRGRLTSQHNFGYPTYIDEMG